MCPRGRLVWLEVKCGRCKTKVSSRRHPLAVQNIGLDAGALAAKLLYTASARDMPHRRSEINSPWGIRKSGKGIDSETGA